MERRTCERRSMTCLGLRPQGDGEHSCTRSRADCHQGSLTRKLDKGDDQAFVFGV